MMAQCKQSAQEFIQDTFSPHIAVLCSHDAELVCRKNNLSFVELIQPFCRINAEAHIRDPNNVSHTVRNLRLVVQDINAHTPQPTLAKKILNEVVSSSIPNAQESMSSIMSVGSYDLQLSASTPWYEAYRERFLQLMYPADHEFSSHLLACMFVVSSSHTNVMDKFQTLTQQQHQQQHQQPHKPPKWFCPNILRYYVLIHDVSEAAQDKAESAYQKMKSTYGTHACHLLQINSNKSVVNGSLDNSSDNVLPPNPWSLFLQKKAPQDAEESRQNDLLPDDDSQQLPSTVVEQTPNSHQPPLPPADPCQSSAVESAMEVIEDVVEDVVTEVVEHPLVSVDDVDNDQRDVENNVSLVMSGGGETGSTGGERGQHGACLSLSDHDRLRIFINEFVVRGLIPWAERMLRSLNEQVITRLKGIQRSLFGVTKKWFGGNKPVNYNQHAERANVVYTGEAPEMQLRRLGDLSFLFQLYELAYQTFHAAKRDFNTDHAWLHYAAALEMASLSVFMQSVSSQRPYPSHYMDSAVTTYLTNCKTPQYATRATLLSTEALKSRNMYAEAAAQFIKLTCEDSDLRSALLLEQAAHCFIQRQPPLVRKYAFHMILAGHRFSKGGQRRHALRSYNQALQVYKGKDWVLAEDHIHFTLGKLSFNLKQLENSSQSFKHLLTTQSMQHAMQQTAFLREFLFVFKQQNADMTGELPQLPLPVIEPNMITVRCGENELGESDGENGVWGKLEELALVQSTGSLPVSFQPFLSVFTPHTLNNISPHAVMGEPVDVDVCLYNPFKIALQLSEVMLLWRFVPVDFSLPDNSGKPGAVNTNETSDFSNSSIDSVKTQVVPEVLLQPQSTSTVSCRVLPHQTGELHITGVAYSLGSGPTDAPGESTLPTNITVYGKLPLEVQGPRLNSTKEEKAMKMYGPDRRLDLLVVPHMPHLVVGVDGIERTALCGEVQSVTVTLTNTGQLPLAQLHLASSHPHLMSLHASPDPTLSSLQQQDAGGGGFVERIALPGGMLCPGHSAQLSMCLLAPRQAGQHQIHWLFTYKSTSNNPKMSHRVTRTTVVLTTVPSIDIKASAGRSQAGCLSGMSSGDRCQLPGLLLLINVHNSQMGLLSELMIDEVACVSRRWQLQSLGDKSRAADAIGRGHSKHICLKASRILKTGDEDVFTSVPFSHQQKGCSVPYEDLYRRSLRQTELSEVDTVSSSNVTQSNPSSSHLASYQHAVDVDLSLIVAWKGTTVSSDGESRSVMGHHTVCISHINSPVSTTPQMTSENSTLQIIPDRRSTELPSLDFSVASRLVSHTIHHPSHFTHDFSSSRLCWVDVTLELFNLSQETVQVSVQACRSSAVKSDDASSVYTPSCRFSWSSHVNNHVILSACASKCLPLQACFTGPGTYNLSMLSILITPVQQPDGVSPILPTAQQPSPPTLIQILSS